jgi:FixJ family two-component response regulator
VTHEKVISIVDDDAEMREALTALIRSLGFTAVAFARAQDFLQSTAPSSSSCLISDMKMPSMSGIELHRQLVRAGYMIPTILITAFPDDQTRADALKSGVICYLPKPFAEERLMSCIRAALSRCIHDGTSP